MDKFQSLTDYIDAQRAPKLADPHRHVPKVVHSRDHHPHSGFNRWLAIKITNAVGSMWMAYIFAIIALIGLPSAIQQAQSQGPLPVVQWVAQTFLQLVLLSIIMVGQSVLQSASDARAEADHETLTAIHEINVKQSEILEALAKK